ncbi:hypothetical protein D3C87_972860 [compost metagenome]
MGEQGAQGQRGDKIAQAAARLDHRPVAGGQRKIAAIAKHGHPRPLQRGHREGGREVDQRFDEDFAKRHGEKQIGQRKGQQAHGWPAEDGQHAGGQHGRGRILFHHGHVGGVGQQPGQAQRTEQQQALARRPGRQRGQAGTLAPGQPATDGHDQETVCERLRAGPQFRHRPESGVVQQHDGGQGQQQRHQRGPAPVLRQDGRIRQAGQLVELQAHVDGSRTGCKGEAAPLEAASELASAGRPSMAPRPRRLRSQS